MDTQAAPPSTSASPALAPEPGLCAAWPRSVQITLGVLLAAGLMFLAGKSWLQSLEAGPSTVPSQRIDLNSAPHAELMLLPGVGDQLARRIVQMRADKGSYQKVDDLRQVPGVGPVTLERLRGWVFISPNPAPAPAEPGLPLTVEPAKRLTAKPKKGTNLTGPIDINTASVAELQQIPGIGPKLSERIVNERVKKPFQTVAELRRVYGIGPKILEKMRPFVTVGSEPRP